MLKKLLTMAAASVMMLSCFSGIASAEYGYQYGEKIAYEGAGGANEFDDNTDTETAKKLIMQGTAGSNNNGEIASTYYYLFDHYKRDENGNLRLNNGISSQVIFNSKGYLLNIDGASRAGKNFYSTSPNLYARFAVVDANAKNGAGINTDSYKNVSSTMTYEFDIQYNKHFFETIGYVSTKLASSYSGRDIQAIKIDSDGKLYSTASNFGGNNQVEIAQLTLGQKHKISVAVKLISAKTNSYNYEMTVYVDGVKKYNTLGSGTVTAGNMKFYGFEMDLRPWTVNTKFSAGSDFTGTEYMQNNASARASINEYVKNEYTIIDTNTTISDFTVYAGDKYAKKTASLSCADSNFYISSNVRRDDINHVTVAAQTAAEDTATAGTLVLATYNAAGMLENVEIETMNFTAGGVSEQMIEVSNANADETRLFIFDNLSGLRPLAALTALD